MVFEYISGITVKEFINQTGLSAFLAFLTLLDDREKLLEVARLVGTSIGRIHQADIVHGDLTTSNLMVINDSNQNYQIVIIDFGLGMTRPVIEDKAVDLYVLERALISTHPGTEYLVSIFLFPLIRLLLRLRQSSRPINKHGRNLILSSKDLK